MRHRAEEPHGGSDVLQEDRGPPDRLLHELAHARDLGDLGSRRAGKLERARSRLHRSQILQVNMRWEALAEIYTMHSFAPFSKLKFLFKNR